MIVMVALLIAPGRQGELVASETNQMKGWKYYEPQTPSSLVKQEL